MPRFIVRVPHPSRSLRRVGWLLCLALTCAIANAQDAHSLAQSIDHHYNHLSTLQADFTERYQGMGMDRTESGTLKMKKPGLMLWSYTAPAGKVFALDGKFAYSYTPGDAQAQRTPSKELDDLRSPLRLLLGHTQLEKELDHLALSTTTQGFRLTGTPTSPQPNLQSLSLDVSPDGTIQSIRIEDSGGATTEFHFAHVRENQPIPKSAFVFTPPDGVDLVDSLPPA